MIFLYIQVVWPFFSLQKKGDPKASFFVSNKVNAYFTMNFWVSEPALTK